MAVMIAGRQAQEYDANEPDEKDLPKDTVLKYIEAVSGAEFFLEIKIESPFAIDSECLLVLLIIDGVGACRHRLMKKDFNTANRSKTFTMKGFVRYTDSQSTHRELRFGDIVTGKPDCYYHLKN